MLDGLRTTILMIRSLTLCLLAPVCFAQETARQAADSANAYAFATFQLFRQITEGNFCYSPYSSHQVAALLTEGARETTADELRKLAHLPAEAAAREEQTKALRSSLAASLSQGSLTLAIANSLWAPSGASFFPPFAKLADEQFGAAVQTLPVTDSLSSARAVNAWVREKTRGRITDLADPAMFGPKTLALVNTVHLKALWASPFDSAKTRPREFTLPNGSSTTLPTMLQMAALNYADSASWQSLELLLGNGEVSMIFLLPRDGPARKKIEEGLSPATWKTVTGALADCDVNVLLPRFAFSTRLNMKSMWQFLGARALFESGEANLSAMAGPDPYFMDHLLHEASIEVNERGAEAVAATIAAAEPFGAGEPPKRRKVSFVANRPFLWAIHHRPTKLILFLGRFAGG